MIIPTDAEKKPFNKTRHPIINTQQTRNRKELPQPAERYENPTATIILSDEDRSGTDPAKIRNKIRTSTLTTSIQHCAGGSNQRN